jgi:hypothetical protein
MEPREIRRIRSGVDETSAWLSLWYLADPRKLDVLHLVVTAPEYRDSRLGSFYMERYDQAVACYGGADRIVVGDRGLDIRLNDKGVKALSLDRHLTLVAPEKLSGWKKSLKWFGMVAGDPSDGVIVMDGQ